MRILLCLVLLLSACKRTDEGVGAGSARPSVPVADTATAPNTPSASVTDAPTAGDMVVIVSIGEPLNLIPAIAQDSASHDVAALVYSGLITLDKDMNIIGDLASSWNISEDNRTIVFHLRQDVRWHDGEPFNADDVVFTYNFLLDNNTPTPYDKDFRYISDIAAIDNYTVSVSYDKPYAPALSSWGMWIMPEHLLKGVMPTQSPLQRRPVGTGPYIFESWTNNQSLTLRANADYYKGEPHITKLTYRYFQDQGAAFMELLKGSVDIMTLTAAQYAMQTDTQRFKEQYNIYRYLDNAYSYVGFNLKRKPFDDKRVRQALSHATPKEQIIDTVRHGLAVPATGPYKPGTLWYNPDVAMFEYDLNKADALLMEAGFTRNDKGVMTKDGKPFKIELIAHQGSTNRIAEIIQNSWGQLGIEVSIRVLEWGTFISEYIMKSDFDITLLAWNIVIDPDPSNVWHSSACAENKTLNFACFQNPEADALMEAGITVLDPKARKVYYDQFQKILAEEQPYIFLYVPQALYAISNRIKGIEPGPVGLFYNIDEWYVPQKEQRYKE